jgi:hypothetical protein
MAVIWSLAGTYFEACNCTVPCPCIFKSPPTDGTCTVMIGWHIERGRFGDIALDGLNIIHMVDVPGLMVDGGWRLARYVDDRGDAAQADALSTIFSGAAGGPPALARDMVAEELGERRVAIDYHAEGGAMSLSITDIASLEMADIAGKEPGPVTIVNSPMGVISNAVKVVSRSSHLTYRDFAMNWAITDKNGYHSPFDYAGP